MTRPNEKTPPPAPASGAGKGPERKPGRNAAGQEAFGRFIGTLARLESGQDHQGKAKGGGR